MPSSSETAVDGLASEVSRPTPFTRGAGASSSSSSYSRRRSRTSSASRAAAAAATAASETRRAASETSFRADRPKRSVSRSGSRSSRSNTECVSPFAKFKSKPYIGSSCVPPGETLAAACDTTTSSRSTESLAGSEVPEVPEYPRGEASLPPGADASASSSFRRPCVCFSRSSCEGCCEAAARRTEPRRGRETDARASSEREARFAGGAPPPKIDASIGASERFNLCVTLDLSVVGDADSRF